MRTDPLAAALQREHHEIDHGIEAFLAGRREGRADFDALARAVEALRRHIFLEEEFLFPPLRAAGLVAPVFVMLREHGEIWCTLDSLQTQIHAAGGDRSDVETCELLLAQLERHRRRSSTRRPTRL
jgi:regulator of cell morphogenesis and NO signaling